MSNSVFYDPKSRYNNIDNNKVVFLTPNQLDDLDVGFPKKTFCNEKDNDKPFPFLLETIKEMIMETTLGEINGSEIEFNIEDSNCKAYICVEINGKLHKLQREEWDIHNNFHGIPLCSQIKVFQRLIKEGKITLKDLETDDINTDVYKKLVINELNGSQICKEKLEKINKIWEEQKTNLELENKRKMLKSL